MILALLGLVGCAGGGGGSGGIMSVRQAEFHTVSCQNFPIGGLPFEKCEQSDVYGNTSEFSYQRFRATIMPGPTGETRLEVGLGISKTNQGYSDAVDPYRVDNRYPIGCRKLNVSSWSDCRETFEVLQEEVKKNFEINGLETTIYRYRISHVTWRAVYHADIRGPSKGYAGVARAPGMAVSMFVKPGVSIDFDSVAALARSITIDRTRVTN